MPQSVVDWILKSRGLDKNVDPDLSEHPMVLSEHVLIGARTQYQQGSTLTKSGGDHPSVSDFTAIGLIQSATISQQKNLQQLYELGSNQLYVTPGRVNVGATLSRVLFDGQSLMRAMYGGLDLDISDAGFSSDSNSFIMNLGSSFLDKPFDLLFLFFNQKLDPMGGFFLENSYCYQHQLVLNSKQTLVIENMGLLASRIISMSVS